jgi:hypothetical protein
MASAANTAAVIDLIRGYMGKKKSAIAREIIAHIVASGYSKTSHQRPLQKLVDAGELQVDELCVGGVNRNIYNATSLLGKTRIHVGKGSDMSRLAFEQPATEGALLLQSLVTGVKVQPCN